MQLFCASLGDAYRMIRGLYEQRAMTPGPVRGIGFASGWTTVEAGETQKGIAFHFNGEHAVYGPVDPAPLTTLQPFVGKSLYRLTEHLLLQEGLVMRSACVAALNALSHPFTDPSALKERGVPLAADEEMEFVRPGDVVTVVGYGRVIGALRRRDAEFHVCDLRSPHSMRTLVVEDQVSWGPPGVTFHTGDDNGALLARSDVVLMTGCTLVNNTLPDLLEQCANARVKGLFGPSAGLLPEYLLGMGLNYILHDRCRAPISLSRAFAQGQRRDALWDSFESVVVRAF